MWSIFQAIKRSWSQHFVEQFSAFVIMTMAYVALLFVAVSLINVQQLFDAWGQIQKVSVYLNSGVKPEKRKDIETFLRSQSMVEEVVVVSSEESAKSFEKRFSKASSQHIDAKHVAKFFPEYYTLSLNQTRAFKSGAGALDEFAEKIKTTFSEVQNVSYGKNWLKRYVGVLKAVHTSGWFLILSFFIAAVVISSSIVKTILYSRRDEIEILEFIGADDFSIYLPQIINSLLLAGISFATALGINFILFLQMQKASANFLSVGTAESLSFVSPWASLSLLFLALLSVGTYSSFTIFSLLPRRKKALLVKGVVR